MIPLTNSMISSEGEQWARDEIYPEDCDVASSWKYHWIGFVGKIWTPETMVKWPSFDGGVSG